MRAQQQAQAQQKEVVDSAHWNNKLMSSINRVARKHRGFASGPSVGQTSSDGVYTDVAFSTRDGWECQASSDILKCANVSMNREFRMQNWQPGSPYYTWISGDGRGFL